MGRRSFDLHDFESQIAAIEAEFERVFAGLTDEQANTRPAADVWSMAHAMEHLEITAKAFFGAWDTALLQGRSGAPAGGSSQPYSMFLRVFRWYIEPPYRSKVKTPAPFVPSHVRSTGDLRLSMSDWHGGMLRRAREASAMDMGHVKVQSPFAKNVSYPIGFSFDLSASHERRHLWQARRIRERLGWG